MIDINLFWIAFQMSWLWGLIDSKGTYSRRKRAVHKLHWTPLNMDNFIAMNSDILSPCNRGQV